MVKKVKTRTRGTRKGGMYGPSYQGNTGILGSLSNAGQYLRRGIGSYGHSMPHSMPHGAYPGGSKRRTKRRRGKAKKSKKRGKGKGKSRRRRH